MKILYDGFIYRDQVVGGINRYFEKIIARLNIDDVPVMLKVERNDAHYPSHPRMQSYYANEFKFRPARFSSGLNRMYLNCFSRLIRPDLIHPTFFKLLTNQKIGDLKCPAVITVHDMTSELYPGLSDPLGREAAMKKEAVKAASAIICVSDNTRSDLLYFYPEVEGKTTVIHHGVDMKPEDGSNLHMPEPYFLFVGSRFPYKNFNFLLESFSKFSSKYADVCLSVTGESFTTEELRLISDLNLSGKINHHGFVDDQYLAALYNQSLAFIYPSIYEGFGLPLLEAMACGTAVLAANDSCFPEIVGDAAILFDPTSQDELVDAMQLVYDNPLCRERLIGKGYSRSGDFTWEKTATATFKLYRSLIAK